MASDPDIVYMNDPANYSVVERAVQTDPRRIWLWGGLMLVIAVVCGAVSLTFAVANWQSHSHLMEAGTTTYARVSDHYFSGRRNSTYHVTFSFDDVYDRSPHTVTQEVDVRTFNSLSNGQVVAITYLPPDTETVELTSQMPGIQEDRTNVMIAVCIGLISLPLVIVGVILIFRRRLSRLKILAGRLLAVNEIEQGDELTLLIRYAFESPAGRHIEDILARRYDPVHDRRPPSPGSAVIIAYINDKRYNIL